jgi:hypothetical protein
MLLLGICGFLPTLILMVERRLIFELYYERDYYGDRWFGTVGKIVDHYVYFFLCDRIILTIDATNDNIYLGIAYEVSHLEAVMSPPK